MWLCFVGALWDPVKRFLELVDDEVVMVYSNKLYPKEVLDWEGRKEKIDYSLKSVVRVIEQYNVNGNINVNATGLPKEIFFGLIIYSLIAMDCTSCKRFNIYILNRGKELSLLNPSLVFKLLTIKSYKKPTLRLKILSELSKVEKATGKEIAARLDESESSVYRSLKSLVLDGLVLKEKNYYKIDRLWGEVIYNLYDIVLNEYV